MTSLLIAGIVFAIVFGGALFGVFLQAVLPDHHRDADSKAVVQLVMGLIATMAALLLSLLVASAHGFYDTQQSEVQELGANIVLLDQVLAHYGPDAAPVRQLLRQDVTAVIHTLSPEEGVGSANIVPGGRPAAGEGILEQVEDLTPATAAQRYDQSTALTLMVAIGKARLLIHEQATSNALPLPLFVVMVAWLTILFVAFGLFARVNGTVIIAMGFGALSVAAAMFLILEMDQPYRGLMRVSVAPITGALAQIGH